MFTQQSLQPKLSHRCCAMLVFRMLYRIIQSSDTHGTESVSVMDHEQTMGVSFRVLDQKQQNTQVISRCSGAWNCEVTPSSWMEVTTIGWFRCSVIHSHQFLKHLQVRLFLSRNWTTFVYLSTCSKFYDRTTLGLLLESRCDVMKAIRWCAVVVPVNNTELLVDLQCFW